MKASIICWITENSSSKRDNTAEAARALPLSVLEGMAAGLPVIATNVGGMADIVKDNGVLIADDDLQALTREMIRFAQGSALRERCGKASRELVKAFDAKSCAEAYMALYKAF